MLEVMVESFLRDKLADRYGDILMFYLLQYICYAIVKHVIFNCIMFYVEG